MAQKMLSQKFALSSNEGSLFQDWSEGSNADWSEDDDRSEVDDTSYADSCQTDEEDDSLDFVKSAYIIDDAFTVAWKDDIKEKNDCATDLDFKYGILQCSFCFNYFHRFRCSMPMSKSSYLSIKKTKLWSCPMCIPDFRPREVIQSKIVRTHDNTSLTQLTYSGILQLIRKNDPIEYFCSLIVNYVNRNLNLYKMYEIG